MIYTKAPYWFTQNSNFVPALGDLYFVEDSHYYKTGDGVKSLKELNLSIIGHLNDAPSNGSTYGREDGEWVVVTGGGGTGDLQDVTDLGNTTTNDIQLLSNAELIFGSGGGVLLDNSSRLREGTIDAGFGGSKGIAQICAVGYELKWEAGRLYVMDGNGVLIRHSLHNFTTLPSSNDDATKGYYVGSLWTLDSGIIYICTDSTTGAATWVQYFNPVAVDGVTITGDGTTGNPLVAVGSGVASVTDDSNGVVRVDNTDASNPIIEFSGTKSEFDTACTDGNFVFVGDAVLNPGGWTIIVKSANQDVTNSATLTDDTDLQFSVVAGGHYMMTLDLTYSGSNSTGDYKCAFAVSSGTINGYGTTQSINAVASAQNVIITAAAASATAAMVFGNESDIDRLIYAKFNFSFTASSNATFKYQFANNGAAAGRTSRTWKGSIVKYKRLD